MKIYNRQGLFDEQNVLEKLTKLGDPLVLVSQHINFTLFKDKLLQFTGRAEATAKPAKGRPSYDVVTMIKIIFLQRLYNLSDDQVEFQITDRLSFRRFLGIPFSAAVPDCKTVWAFRELLNNTISIYTIVQFIWTSTFQKLTFINIHGLSCVYSIGLLYN